MQDFFRPFPANILTHATLERDQRGITTDMSTAASNCDHMLAGQQLLYSQVPGSH